MRGCVGTTDRVIRVLVGGIVLGAGLTQTGALGMAWAYGADVVGGIGLATGLLGRCPLYSVVGVRTCKRLG